MGWSESSGGAKQAAIGWFRADMGILETVRVCTGKEAERKGRQEAGTGGYEHSDSENLMMGNTTESATWGIYGVGKVHETQGATETGWERTTGAQGIRREHQG